MNERPADPEPRAHIPRRRPPRPIRTSRAERAGMWAFRCFTAAAVLAAAANGRGR